ncbi:MAG: M48 family metallopeptidase [Planctomycetota bacterium]|jgi:Zn-dependent protease with chaperone function
MAMDFFESQEAARRRTWALVVLFVLAVLATIVLVYLAVSAVVVFYGARQGGLEPAARTLLHPALLAAVGASTLAVVGAGSGYKMMQLRAGGAVVAETLGGRPADPGRSLGERRLVNVVEEMAIASGMPVPLIYLLEQEAGINAFAAGHSPDDAVIGVTRGAVDRLSRDELQGVVGHEFSHILNGDMRLNMRLMGWLHGILVVGLIGTILLRQSARVSLRSRRGGSGPVILIGVALMIVGYAGTFFGKLIKAAVSRQREFLADAAAVQFTRNPAGIAGALKRIGAASAGARLSSPRADEASHMYFAQGVTVHLSGLFATHPPLARRIRRLDPEWDGTFPPEDAGPGGARRPTGTGAGTPPAIEATAAAIAAAAPAGSAVAQIGRLTEPHLRYAERLVAALPLAVRVAAQEPFSARAVVCSLLLAEDRAVRDRQVRRLESIDPPLAELAGRLARPDLAVSELARLPLLELAMPALRQMSAGQYARFRTAIDALHRADERIDLFEWMLLRIVTHLLQPQFDPRPPIMVQHHGLQQLLDPCSVLLSTLARVGHRDERAVRAAFSRGGAELPAHGLVLLPPARCTLPELDDALAELETLAPGLKRAVLDGCAVTVAADRQVTTREGELLRALAASLGCPMPPLLPGQRVG